MGAPIAHYSHGVMAGNLIFVAGQVPVDASGQLVGAGDIGAQTRQVIKNVEAVLAAEGASLADVVSTTVYLTNFDRYKDYDRVYAECFGGNRPARATVRADLVRPEWLVEIQAIAVKRS
jgi:reactive intermediate/imine deaminase